MSAKRLLIFGCGGAMLLGVILVAAIGVWVWYVVQDPEGVSISVESPESVKVGQQFDLTVVVQNTRTDAAFKLTDIDLAEEYIEGFLISSTEPQAQSIIDSQSFTFDVDIPPQQSKRFTFHLRPTKPGVFRGDVDVYEGQRFITTSAQTWVTDE